MRENCLRRQKVVPPKTAPKASPNAWNRVPGAFNRFRVAAFALALGYGLSGCLGSQRLGPLGGIADESPYVELYVEYSGPAERWAGPVSFLLHVSARDSEKVTYQVSPVSFFESDPAAVEVISRTPASADTATSGGAGKAQAPSVMPPGKAIAEARERFAELAEQIESSTERFRACLSPVRVRLIRQDGGLKEWEGCRSSRGWPKAVSEFTDKILNGSVG
jgi:hypothetical protein